MTNLFGVLGLNDTDRVYVRTLGQSVVYDATRVLMEQYNRDLAAQLSVFVGETTGDHKRRYKLPGGGRLQKRGGMAQSGAVKASGQWDVAFPLDDFGAQLAWTHVAEGYMTLQEYQRHLDGIFLQDANTVRFELLKALLNNTQRTFVDPLWGSLSIESLANGDSVVYPPVLGSESEATENHYLESGYATSAISDANDPFATIGAELEEHFGAVSGGSNIVAFIPSGVTPYARDLTDFVPVTDMGISPGDDTATIMGAPGNVPGRLIGRMEGAGVWVVEWRWLPANYIVATHMEAAPPLIERVDPDDTGLPRGLALIAEEEEHPFKKAHYVHRFGFGAGNRLNGVVMELGTGGTYSIPSGYS